MTELHGDIELSLEQAATIAKAMLEVAESDGVHQREQEMIDGFWKECAAASNQENADLGTDRYDAETARTILGSQEHAAALIKSCYLLALADGDISAAEEAKIAEISGGLNLDEASTEACAKEAKLYLLNKFKGVSVFKEVAWDIGRKLGLDEATLGETLS